MEENNANLLKEKPKLESENLESIKIIDNLKAENTLKPTKKEESLAKITDLSPEKLDPNEFVGIKLGDFEDDQFLTLKYGEFVQIVSQNLEGKLRMDAFPVLQKLDAKENWENCDASTHSLVRLLDIGILANEIWHYILTMKALNGKKLEGKSKNRAKMEMEWAQLRKVKLEEHITSKNLEQSLFMLLKKISVEGFAVKNIQNLNLEEMFDEIGQIRQQLHLRKFAIAFFKNERILDKNRRKIIWSKLFKDENEKKMNCLIDKMEKYLILNEKLNEQIKIDKDLFVEYRSKFSKFVDEKVRKSFVDSEKWTLPDEFAKTWQEIKFKDNLKLNLDQKIEIEKYLTTNGYLSKEKMSKKQQIMGQLSLIVKGWCPEATVYFAKLILESEVLESICILPEEFDKQLIVGRLNCETSERTKCADLSLYCVLCTHSAVKMPRKTDNNQYLPPLLKMEFHFLGVPVEISFIFVPIDKLPASAEPVDLGTFQTLTKYFAKNIEKFDDKFEMDRVLVETKQLTKSKEEAIKKRQIVTDQKAMLVALTKNFMNEKIFEILSPVPKLDKKYCNKMANERGDVDKLRIVLAYLEMWAKNNFIFGTEMGYLNLPMLLIMAAKVFLMFPEASVPFLIEKYFLIYSKWKWPIPVQLAPIKQKKRGDFLSWSPGREWTQFEGESAHKTIGQVLAMPIISPLFPEQNEANRINLLTAKVIQNELKMAFVHLRNMNDSQLIIAPILGNKKFTEKYDHFVIFICGGTEYNVETFCHFVGKRLRHELLLLLVEQSFANLFNFFHVYPKLVHFEQSAGDPKNANEQKRKWLIGLKLHKQKRKTKPQELFTSEMIKKLAEIDLKIKNDFEKDSLYKVNLKSEYVERSKVDKWNY